MTGFVDVYSLRTRKKQRVPRSWIGKPWAAGLVLTPRQKAADRRATPAVSEMKEIPAEPEKEA